MSHLSAPIRIAIGLLLAVSTATLGCKSDSGGPTGTSPPPPPPATWTSLIGRTWTVPSGATQDYLCTGIRVPADLYIRGFRTTADAGQYRLYLTVADSTFNPVGDFTCSAGVHEPRYLYASGAGTPDITFPAGVGVHLKAGQYIILTLEFYNPTASDESGSTEVSIEKGTAADVVHETDLLMSGRRNFPPIPPGKYVVGGGCSSPQDFQVFAQIPMMHLLGTGQVNVLATGPVLDTVLNDTTYKGSSNEYLQTSFSVHKNDQVIINCLYDNTTGHVIAYGDNVNFEQCIDGIYRYPAPTTDSIFDCLTD